MIHGQEHGFLYGSGSLSDLGVLAGGTNSYALGLNNSNQVVGASTICNGVVHAFLWQNGALTDLNSLLPVGSSWELREARGINDSGQIVGWGLRNGREQAFLLSPPVSGPGQPIAGTRTRLHSSQANGGETPPSVTITNPVNNATFAAPTNLTIYAEASDSDGTVTQVQFFAGTNSLATATTSPHSVTWSNVAVGSYALTAIATDNDGLTATSSVVNITVTLPQTASIKVWLKADAISGLTNGAAVATWGDSSGANNNAYQATAANRPLYWTNSINGNPVVRYDGANDYFSLPNLFSGSTQAEAFVVLKATADTPSATRSLWIFGSYNYYGNWYGMYPATDGTISEDFGTTGLNNIGNPTQPLDQFHLYNVAGKSGEWTARINGLVQYATTNNTFGYAGSPKLGFGASYFAGDLSEVLIFNRTLTGDERDAVNMYLNSKYALVTNAPVAPTNLTATAISSSQVNLTWNSSLGTASTLFKLERKTGTGGTYAQIAVLRDATTYLDTNLAASTAYYYRVKAGNFAGDSDFSNEANATTAGGGADLPMSNLKLWLKADAGVTRQGTNNSVEFWFDQSGRYNDARQQTAANQPQWVDNAMNGRPVVRFDANSRYFNLPNLLNGATQAEAFVVLKATADTPTATRGLWIFGSYNYYGNWYGYYPATDGTISEDFGTTGLNNIGNPVQPLDQNHVYNVVGRAGEWTARINGMVQYTTTNNTFGYTASPKLGFGGGYFAGDVAEVLIYDRALSSDERDVVNGYLNARYAMVTAVPSAPTNLVVQAISGSQINLGWNYSLNNAGTRFLIERKTGVGGTYAQIAEVQDGTGFLDANLSANTEYFYRVRARNFAGASDYSNEANATTLTGGAGLPTASLRLWLKADTGVVRQGTNNSVAYWFDQSGRYNDARQQTAANQPQWVDNVMNGRPVVRFDANSRYFNLPNLLNGATQAEAFVVLKATADTPTATRGLWIFGSYNYFGNWYGKYPATDGTITEDFGSTALFGIGNPTQPLDQFHVYNVAGKTGEWTARINGVVQYTTPNNTFGYTSAPKLGFGTSYFAGDIAEVLIYDQTLTGDDRDGVNRYLNSKYVLVTSASGAPTNLVASAISASQVSLTWNFALGNTSTTFKIERKTGAGSYSQIALVRDATSYLDAGLAAGTQYEYRVRANNSAGDSIYSNEASAATAAGAADLPLDMKLWVRADAGVVKQSSGSTVATWLDQSSSGNHLTQTTPASQPTLIASAANSRPVIRFDAVNDYFNVPNLLNGATQAEVFVVLKASADVPGSTRGLWNFGSYNYYGYVYGTYPATDGTITEDFGSTSLYNIGNPATPLDQYHLYDVFSTSGEWTARINGIVQFTTNYTTFGITAWPKLGVGQGYFAGDVAELLIYLRTLSGAERQTIGYYLNQKYNLTTSIPATPSNLKAAGVSSTQLKLTWSRASTNETSFAIERRVNTDGTWTFVGAANGNATNYLDQTGAAEINYSYRVSANTYSAQSQPCSEITPPTVTVTSPTNGAALSSYVFTLGAGAVSNSLVTLVEFFHGPRLLGATNTSPATLIQNNFPAGTASFSARATDSLGNSRFSPTITATVFEDSDGDGLSNDSEILIGTDPTRADTDGDGVPDAQDAFPLDPNRSVLPSSDPNDHTAPVITLEEPAGATLLP
jgi:probable HAF family extracellular repeat protein